VPESGAKAVPVRICLLGLIKETTRYSNVVAGR